MHRALSGSRLSLSGPILNKKVNVILLTGEELHLVTDNKAKVQHLFDQVCQHLNLRETQYFGLAIKNDGEFWFLDVVNKISKYAPKAWKSKRGDGCDAVGRPLLKIYFRVQYYVYFRLLREKITRHLYYLQLVENVLTYQQLATQEKCFQLAAFALQATFGNYSPGKHTGHYFQPKKFLPSWVISERGEKYILLNLSLMHKDLRGLSKVQAELNFIKEASAPPMSHNMLLYRLKKKKSEKKPSLWISICPNGLEIYEDVPSGFKDELSVFEWGAIGRLQYNKKKFEIQMEHPPHGRKFTYYTTSHDYSGHLLWLCQKTHSLQMALQSSVSESKRQEEEERKHYRESYIYSDDVDLALEQQNDKHSLRDKRISLISKTSSVTTSGIASEKIQASLDSDNGDDGLSIKHPPSETAIGLSESSGTSSLSRQLGSLALERHEVDIDVHVQVEDRASSHEPSSDDTTAASVVVPTVQPAASGEVPNVPADVWSAAKPASSEAPNVTADVWSAAKPASSEAPNVTADVPTSGEVPVVGTAAKPASSEEPTIEPTRSDCVSSSLPVVTVKSAVQTGATQAPSFISAVHKEAHSAPATLDMRQLQPETHPGESVKDSTPCHFATHSVGSVQDSTLTRNTDVKNVVDLFDFIGTDTLEKCPTVSGKKMEPKSVSCDVIWTKNPVTAIHSKSLSQVSSGAGSVQSLGVAANGEVVPRTLPQPARSYDSLLQNTANVPQFESNDCLLYGSQGFVDCAGKTNENFDYFEKDFSYLGKGHSDPSLGHNPPPTQATAVPKLVGTPFSIQADCVHSAVAVSQTVGAKPPPPRDGKLHVTHEVGQVATSQPVGYRGLPPPPEVGQRSRLMAQPQSIVQQQVPPQSSQRVGQPQDSAQRVLPQPVGQPFVIQSDSVHSALAVSQSTGHRMQPLPGQPTQTYPGQSKYPQSVQGQRMQIVQGQPMQVQRQQAQMQPVKVLPGQPMQVHGQPMQVQGQPMQVQGQPMQVHGQPMQVQGQLMQVQGQPMQVQGQPMQVHGQLIQGQGQQMHGQPMQVQGQPMQVHGQPNQGQGQLMQGHGQHMQMQGQLMQMHGQPMQMQGQPMQVHGQPMQVQGQPMQMHGQPMQVQRQPVQMIQGNAGHVVTGQPAPAQPMPVDGQQATLNDGHMQQEYPYDFSDQNLQVDHLPEEYNGRYVYPSEAPVMTRQRPEYLRDYVNEDMYKDVSSQKKRLSTGDLGIAVIPKIHPNEISKSSEEISYQKSKPSVTKAYSFGDEKLHPDLENLRGVSTVSLPLITALCNDRTLLDMRSEVDTKHIKPEEQVTLRQHSELKSNVQDHNHSSVCSVDTEYSQDTMLSMSSIQQTSSDEVSSIMSGPFAVKDGHRVSLCSDKSDIIQQVTAQKTQNGQLITIS